MSSTASRNETEIKLAVPDAAAAQAMLLAHGFEILHPRVFERNVLYDTADLKLRDARSILRLRSVDDQTILTFKGPAEAGIHKTREEIETMVGNCGNFELILVRLGYASTFIYEKFRTEFHRSREPGVVTLDETPIGVFLEIEGEPDWIDRTAGLLGFEASRYINRSYVTLYFQWCERMGVMPSNMVFGNSN